MKKILAVTHCLLNTSSKVISHNEEEIKEESKRRKELLQYIIDEDIQILQLPCPEFTMYGTNRWGHVKNQFDNPFFRQHCKTIIEPIITQLEEYERNKDKFKVLGIVAIDGSPSCGYKFTCKGDWYGELGGCSNLNEKINSIKLEEESGVFIEEVEKLLKDKNLHIKIVDLKDIITYLKNL